MSVIGVSRSSDRGFLGTEIDEGIFQPYTGTIPVRPGNYGLSKKDDPDYRKPVQRWIPRAHVFNLSDEAQLAKYEEIMQEIYDRKAGATLIAHEIAQPCNGNPYWTAFVQWRVSEILPPSEQGR